MKIGVSGASGQLGKAVVRELLERGQGKAVVAISRTPKNAPAGVEGRLGDYDAPESLASAYAGLNRLLLIPSSEVRPGKRSQQNETAIRAAIDAGVGQIVLMSSAGTREQAEPHIGASYWRGEQTLIKNAPSWVIMRMNYYAQALAQEAAMAAAQGAIVGLAENRVAFVAREDVAAAAAGVLLGEGHSGAIYNATGARTFSGAERAQLISEIIGKPVSFVVVPEDGLRGGMIQMELPEDVVNTVLGIQSEFARGAFDIVTGDVERLAGRAPKPLRDVLAAELTPRRTRGA
jgi:NAD(P)H dehydrogenase (quinone)